MTERAVVEFDHRNPDDVAAQVNAAVTALDMSSFDRISRRLTEHAVAILEAAEVPPDPTLMYVLRCSEEPPFIEVATQKDIDDEAVLLALDQAIAVAGFEPDSAEGFASRILTRLHLSRQLLERDDADGAMAFAFEIGALVTEASMKAVFERDFLVGEKVIAGGRMGHRQAHGTSEEKQAKQASYVAAFEAALAKGDGKMVAYRTAAKQCKVDVATIRRAIRKPVS